MMSNWYDPFTPGERIKRCFSMFNLALAALVLLACASELRFDWVEQLTGAFLMATNSSRPETGGIWESGRQALNAHQSLNRIINEKQDALREVQEADSFSSLASRLGPGEWVNVDKPHFRHLFESLPATVKTRVAQPIRLVWLLSTDTVDRIFCEGQMGGLVIYFIDTGNRVVFQMALGSADFADVPGEGRSDAPMDEGTFTVIVPAQRFFSALFQLPEDMLAELVGNPEKLLRQEGTLTRVGIGETADNGYIRLGFEFATLEQVRVVQVLAREWAVWQLNLILKGEDR